MLGAAPIRPEGRGAGHWLPLPLAGRGKGWRSSRTSRSADTHGTTPTPDPSPQGGGEPRGATPRAYPAASAVLELFKPITWFPPMWAFACGIVSSGRPLAHHWLVAIVGVALAGPLVCATSQAVNDWFDRHVDAINEPQRPIPSGRIPGRWGLAIACAWTLVSLAVAVALGTWVFVAACVGLALAWAYSAPPLRLKHNGWWGNLACGLCYESLAWVTGAAVLLGGGLPPWPILTLALLYGLGAHGIMTLNDFKAMDGDRRMGVRSLPVQLGPQGAARVACAVMAAPQLVVIALLIVWDRPIQAGIVLALLAGQAAMMARFLQKPVGRALWYSGFGIPLYVSGMMASAVAVASFARVLS